ncbi:MAG TPA: D-alanyl-D-alanine carboxypeptidase/D-alanyl-D-alanine-endopeptidase [Candidatus Desulfaltia sp.]|nr:D-alanyl-D-alanine carboxypeptidase/D-alanyl-D-alanine-endopeptidase [Candidatus Desulfaltia sp.]
MKKAGVAFVFFFFVVFSLGVEFCLAAGGAADVADTAPLPSASDLQRRIDGILGAAGLSRVLFSVCVVHGETGEIVYEKNAHLALIPASNMKIVTSAAALEHLGQGFAFITRVGLCGDALVVKGSGDPLLGDKETDARNGGGARPVIRDIVLRLKELGIVAVSDIVLDTSIFDGERVHPSWPENQLHQKYACEVGGLNYNGNCVDISAAQRNGKVVLTLDPPSDYIQLANALTVRRSRKSWFSVKRTDVPNVLVIQGNCRTQAGPYSVAVENPALFFGRLLREALVREGIDVGGEVLEGPAPEGCEFREVIAFSTSIRDCLLRTNKDSLGLAAEAMLKRLAAQSDPDQKPGSWDGGKRVLAEYLQTRGVDEREFVIADGSGLSRDNRLSANALTRVLMHLAAGPDWEFYRGTLAVGGLDGTIEKHFWETKYRGRVQAKSGYIQAVRALSGVVRTDSGDYIFSILANRAGNGARGAIDSAVKAVVDWAARPAAP